MTLTVKSLFQPQSNESPRLAAVARRDAEALALRTRGYKNREIAEQLGYSSPNHACLAVKRALANEALETKAEKRAIELKRLEYLLQKSIEIVEQNFSVVSAGQVVGEVDVEPNLKAINTALRVMKRHAEAEGTDAPTRTDVRITDTTDQAIQQLAAELDSFTAERTEA